MKKFEDNFQVDMDSDMYEAVVGTIRAFGIPTADELRRMYARWPTGKDHTLARPKVDGKKTVISLVNLFRHIQVWLRERAGVSKTKI